MKVLIVGKGGREHALAWKISQGEKISKIYVAPGNPGTEELGVNVPIDECDIISLADFAQENNIDLTVVGPESSLALGIADEFKKRNLKIFAPTAASAKIESSKDFAKEIMKKYNIPTAAYSTFTELFSAKDYVKKMGAPIVIKEDGLCAGKGVTVAETLEEAMEALESAFSKGENRVVIEEKLEGFEFSLIALVHGELVIPLDAAQDHKRAYNGDKGPNTGGMGVYSPVDRIDANIIRETMKEIMVPMAKALSKEGIPFTGFLFGGIMLTDSGVKTIEFNARFGDPEAEAILPRLENDLLEVILGLLKGNLSELSWDKRYTLGAVMASENYPLSSTLGAEIKVGNLSSETLLFHMGTSKDSFGNLVTGGGRVLIPIVFGDTLNQAKQRVYEELRKINCKKLFFRDDIGSKSCYNDGNI
ncbi:MAG: phosphoribosylamine--glycine ligase [Fusobacteriaceae bacterium]